MRKMKQSNKRKGKKISLTKLSNKKLNKLAKQGKLKKQLGKRQLIELAKRRTGSEIEIQPKKAETDVDNIPLEDADFEYFGSGVQDLGFLDLVRERNNNERKQGKKRKQNTNDLEESYERVPRKIANQTEKEMKPLLPIKSKQGIIPQSVTCEDEIEQPEEEKQEEEETEPEELPVLSTAELLHLRQQKVEDAKRRIALLASSLIEQPEAKISKLKELRQMLTEPDQDISTTIRKLVIASMLEVFKDIIPGYRIRQYTEKEKHQSMKKETKQLKEFEEVLLSCYHQYLQFLESVIKGKIPKSVEGNKWKKQLNRMSMSLEEAKIMKDLALKCLCELLLAHPHFNYRTNILALIVPFMDSKNSQISDIISGTIKQLFKEDRNGEVSLEAVRIIAKLTKSRRFDVKPKLLESFLSLRVKEVLKPGDEGLTTKRNEKNQFISRKEKKRQKQMKHLEKELKDAAALDDKKHKLRMNTQIVEAVFLTYFRILKYSNRSILLSTVLEGLAKFAHLINIDFFDDLFTVLNGLIESETLTYRESLHCIQTACTILTGQGSSLNIDPLRFYKHLYNTMFHLHAGMSSVDVPTALESMDLLLNKRRRQVSLQRLLAFIKRTTTVAVSLTSDGTLGSLAAIRSLLSLNSKTDILFDLDSQGSGIFVPELEEPEHCNAHNTALFELQFLRNHYHPTVREYTKYIMKEISKSSKSTSLPPETCRRSPVQLYQEYDTANMEFKPSLESLERPAANKGKNKKAKAGMIQEDFERELQSVLDSVKDIR